MQENKKVKLLAIEKDIHGSCDFIVIDEEGYKHDFPFVYDDSTIQDFIQWLAGFGTIEKIKFIEQDNIIDTLANMFDKI